MFYQKVYQSEIPFRVRLLRGLWGGVWSVGFCHTPRPFFAWRSLALRLFGARIGRGCRVYPGVRVFAPWNLSMKAGSSLGDGVDCYCVDEITLGPEAIVSQSAKLCTAWHDIDSPVRALKTAPIHIGEGVLVFSGAYVGPGVNVGRGAVVGACAVVTKDVPSFAVVAGNPAKIIKSRDRSAFPEQHTD